MPNPNLFKLSKGLKGLKEVEAAKAAKAFEAQHASPHKFNKFELSERTSRTGEGAQSFGHGLYFSDVGGAAEKQYLPTFAAKNRKLVGEKGEEIDPNSLPINEELFAVQVLLNNAGDYEKAAQDIAKWSTAADAEPLLKALNALREKKFSVKEDASLYRVKINADPEKEFLQWDDPLRPEDIKRLNALRHAFSKKGIDLHPEAGYTAEEAYRALSDMFYSQEVATRLFKKAGFKGVRYKDAVSRGKEGGTYNYVVFDDSIIEILDRNGQKVTGAALTALLAGMMGGGSEKAEAQPATAQEAPKDYGARTDGTRKGQGWLGPLKLKDGSVATEYSMPMSEEGEYGTPSYKAGPLMPTLVPTLTKDEQRQMIEDIIPNHKPIPPPIYKKARAHAEKRIAEGKSPFLEEGEAAPKPAMDTPRIFRINLPKRTGTQQEPRP